MTTTDEREGYSGWSVLELMGHRRLVGLLSEVEVAGAGFLRIQIPKSEGEGWAAEQLYAPAAVYAITPATEETVRRMAARSSLEDGVTPFRLPDPPVRWSCTNKDDDGHVCRGSIAVPESDSRVWCSWCYTLYRVERTEAGVLFHRLEDEHAGQDGGTEDDGDPF